MRAQVTCPRCGCDCHNDDLPTTWPGAFVAAVFVVSVCAAIVVMALGWPS